jgi:hypothetical protein
MHKRLRELGWGASAAALLSCAPVGRVPGAASVPSTRESSPDRHTVVMATLDCVMAPIVYDTPPWATEEELLALGPNAASCVNAAQAVHVGPARLYRLDRDALFDVRHAIDRAQSTTRSPGEAADQMLLFDQSIAAIMEARRGRAALAQSPTHGPDSVEKIRARTMVVKLDDFGRKLGGTVGVEARAIAMLMATSAFLQVARAEPRVRPYVAEPLFTMMFGSEFVSESALEAGTSWSDYLAAAARSIPGRENADVAEKPAHENGDSTPPAVGGGPVDTQRRDLGAVTSAAAREMRALAADLPPGRLRAAVERTAMDLATYDVATALSER